MSDRCERDKRDEFECCQRKCMDRCSEKCFQDVYCDNNSNGLIWIILILIVIYLLCGNSGKGGFLGLF